MELKAMIERTRPDVKCFLSGDNPNGSNLAIIISTALADAKMAIIMGSKTYGKKTESPFSTFEEMDFILREREEKPMFLLKMCDEWEEPQTRLMMGSRKYKKWEDGQVTQALVDEILEFFQPLARVPAAHPCASARTRPCPHYDRQHRGIGHAPRHCKRPPLVRRCVVHRTRRASWACIRRSQLVS